MEDWDLFRFIPASNSTSTVTIDGLSCSSWRLFALITGPIAVVEMLVLLGLFVSWLGKRCGWGWMKLRRNVG